MLNTKMIRLNQLLITSGLSLMNHGYIINKLEESKKVEEINVDDLS